MILPLAISPDARELIMDELRDFLTSDAQIPLAQEVDWAATLDAEIAAAEVELAANANSARGWLRYTQASALKRSIQYAGAGRGALMAHGYHNGFREIYEGSKQADDAGIV